MRRVQLDVTREPDGTIPVYLIWYGDWAAEAQNPNNANSTQTIVTQFFAGLSGSKYWGVSALYYDTAGNVASKLRVAGAFDVLRRAESRPVSAVSCSSCG